MDIREVLRRWQAGDSRRQIAAATGLSRVAIAKYLKKVEQAGLTSATQADDRLLAVLQGQRHPRGRKREPSEDLLSKHEEQLQLWLCHDHLQLTRVPELLLQRQPHRPEQPCRRARQQHAVRLRAVIARPLLEAVLSRPDGHLAAAH